jgi:hypothetical protein
MFIDRVLFEIVTECLNFVKTRFGFKDLNILSAVSVGISTISIQRSEEQHTPIAVPEYLFGSFNIGIN